MSVELVFRNRQRRRKINLQLLRSITLAIVEDDLQITPACISTQYEIGIHLVNAAQSARLNARFLEHAGSTDVITLEYDEWERTPVGELWILGDIFVCVDEAIGQARRFRTTWQSELARYVIHGLLHLRGYDDSTAAARRTMKREENRLLKEIGRRFPLSKLARNSRLAA